MKDIATCHLPANANDDDIIAAAERVRGMLTLPPHGKFKVVRFIVTAVGVVNEAESLTIGKPPVPR